MLSVPPPGSKTGEWARLALAYSRTCTGTVSVGCWVSSDTSAWPACKRYLYKGLYGHHIGFWLSFVEPSRVAVVRSELLFSERAKAVKLVECFLLGISPCVVPGAAADVTGSAKPLARTGSGAPRGASAHAVTWRSSHAGAPTCWHNCGVRKSGNVSVFLPSNLRLELDRLYHSSEEALKFHSATATRGGITFIG